jgi:hypothetical protein
LPPELSADEDAVEEVFSLMQEVLTLGALFCARDGPFGRAVPESALPLLPGRMVNSGHVTAAPEADVPGVREPPVEPAVPDAGLPSPGVTSPALG